MDKRDTETRQRRSIRLKDYDYTQEGAYFITICTNQKERVFGAIINGEMSLSGCGDVASKRWQSIPAHFPHIGLDEFTIMPNHVHGIIIINKPVGAPVPVKATTSNDKAERFGTPTTGSIPTIIRSYKSAVTKELNQGEQSRRKSVWQRGYYEHVIRNEDSMEKIREYIHYNPMKWCDDKYYVE